MTPRPITDVDLDWWRDGNPRRAQFTGPGEVEAGIEPCPAVVIDDPNGIAAHIVCVPWTLDEIELAHLARGGTLWLQTWGSLPVHNLQVQAP